MFEFEKREIGSFEMKIHPRKLFAEIHRSSITKSCKINQSKRSFGFYIKTIIGLFDAYSL